MAVNLKAPEELSVIEGIRISSAAAGIKKNGSTDLVLIEIQEGASCAAVFTQNRFRAAPVVIAESHLEKSQPRCLMINSGNANAGTGDSGYQNAINTCQIAAKALNCDTDEVLPFSTGVIGQNLPVKCFDSTIPMMVESLSEQNWLEAAKGIMTTDTVAKAISKKIKIDGIPVTITGIAKGSGMIKPDMATMLGFVATDATIGSPVLKKLLKSTVDISFNAITVDGDTSTNDSCVLIATGKSPAAEITEASDAYDQFLSVLTEVMQYLAQAIIRDGEGATKFIEIKVHGARTYQDAKTIAYTVAHSPLVKTALFASDPNWGRILAAVGRAEIAELKIEQLKIFLNDVCIVSNGGRDENYTEEAGQQEMSKDEILIYIDLADGDQSASVWTSDLSYEYVKINAEYRT